MPVIRILERNRLMAVPPRARQHFRLALSALRERIVPGIGLIGHLRRVLDLRAARAAFAALRACFSLRDRLAGLCDRLPARPDMAGSTMLAYGAVGVMAAILANDLIAPTPAVSSVTPTPAPRPDWIEIARPHGAFALEAPALGALEARHQVRRHRAGSGRKDELTFGSPDGSGPYVRVSIYRPGAEGIAEPDALRAVVAVAAESGINAELAEAGRKMTTKFGALPMVSMTIAGGAGPRNCLAAAGSWNDPRLGLVAWWCNDGPEIVAQGEFACLLDRLSLMSAGGDDRLAEFFARIELRRNFCNVQSSFVSPTPRLVNDWMHDRGGPRLRGKLHAR